MATQTDTAEQTRQQVTLTRVFTATRQAVWAAWTTPKGFAGWFGTPPYTTPASRVSMDVHADGEWRATQVSEIDGAELPFMGHYREVIEPERLVFTFEDPDNPDDPNIEIATVILRGDGGVTEMTFNQRGHLPEEQYGMLEKGYTLFFDRLEEYLAKSA
ncbi:MAG TPA: SRPBCC domain-containing protein [Coriobacteriia bacterium]|nr:SRPBCC domain-containing protein [Coriobacteriia bacterium]